MVVQFFLPNDAREKRTYFDNFSGYRENTSYIGY
jgi:hypothetical protein